MLDVLPALPAAWPQGELRGSLARGQIKIDRLAWDQPASKLWLELTSGMDQMLTLRLPAAATPSATAQKAELAESARGPNSHELTLKAGRPARGELTPSSTN